MRTNLRAHAPEVARAKTAPMLLDQNVQLRLRRENQIGQQIDQRNLHVGKGNQAPEIPVGRLDIQPNRLEASGQPGRTAKNHATFANPGVGRRTGIVRNPLEASVQLARKAKNRVTFADPEVESRTAIVPAGPLEANVQLVRRAKVGVNSVSREPAIRVETVINHLGANDPLARKEANDESFASPEVNRTVQNPKEGIAAAEIASRQEAEIAPGHRSLTAIVLIVQCLAKKKKRLLLEHLIAENSPKIDVRLRSLTAAA
jgi:hypothetical protein